MSINAQNSAQNGDRVAGRVCLPWDARLLAIGLALLASGLSMRAVEPVIETASVMAMSFEGLLDVNVDKVYGASRYEQRVTRAPASVSLVTRDEISRQGHRTLGEVLRSANGIFLTDDPFSSTPPSSAENWRLDLNSRPPCTTSSINGTAFPHRPSMYRTPSPNWAGVFV